MISGQIWIVKMNYKKCKRISKESNLRKEVQISTVSIGDLKGRVIYIKIKSHYPIKSNNVNYDC